MEEKSKLLRYLPFNKIRYIFSTLALCFTLTIFSSSISRSSLFEIPGILLSRHFVFLLGNVIVVTLFVKFSRENESVADDEHLISDAQFDPAGSFESLEFPISWSEIADQVKRCRRLRTEDEVDLDEIEYNQTESRREVDDLSNEEFQREVEAFIERQWRLLRQESDLPVVPAT